MCFSLKIAILNQDYPLISNMESHFAECQKAHEYDTHRAVSMRDGSLEYSQHVWLKVTGQTQNYTLSSRGIFPLMTEILFIGQKYVSFKRICVKL